MSMPQSSQPSVSSQVDFFYIPTFGDIYCVGTNGTVWSRYVRLGWRRGWGISDRWRKLKGCQDSRGYMRVSLSIHSVTYIKFIHSLVCEAIHGPCPPNMECCHADGNPHNI